MNPQADRGWWVVGSVWGGTVDKNSHFLCVDSVPDTARPLHTFSFKLQNKPSRWNHHAQWAEEETEAGVEASKVKPCERSWFHPVSRVATLPFTRRHFLITFSPARCLVTVFLPGILPSPPRIQLLSEISRLWFQNTRVFHICPPSLLLNWSKAPSFSPKLLQLWFIIHTKAKNIFYTDHITPQLNKPSTKAKLLALAYKALEDVACLLLSPSPSSCHFPSLRSPPHCPAVCGSNTQARPSSGHCSCCSLRLHRFLPSLPFWFLLAITHSV